MRCHLTFEHLLEVDDEKRKIIFDILSMRFLIETLEAENCENLWIAPWAFRVFMGQISIIWMKFNQETTTEKSDILTSLFEVSTTENMS